MNKEEEREKKLDTLQSKHRRLLVERIPISTDYKKKLRILTKAQEKLAKHNREIRDTGEQIYHLKNAGLTPHVTDHAIVRYLERVEGLDIWAIKVKIAEDKNAVREGNVIVTVNEDLSDELR